MYKINKIYYTFLKCSYIYILQIIYLLVAFIISASYSVSVCHDKIISFKSNTALYLLFSFFIFLLPLLIFLDTKEFKSDIRKLMLSLPVSRKQIVLAFYIRVAIEAIAIQLFILLTVWFSFKIQGADNILVSDALKLIFIFTITIIIFNAITIYLMYFILPKGVFKVINIIYYFLQYSIIMKISEENINALLSDNAISIKVIFGLLIYLITCIWISANLYSKTRYEG